MDAGHVRLLAVEHVLTCPELFPSLGILTNSATEDGTGTLKTCPTMLMLKQKLVVVHQCPEQVLGHLAAVGAELGKVLN